VPKFSDRAVYKFSDRVVLLRSISPSSVENSLLFRLLVQVMVGLSILTIGLAAQQPYTILFLALATAAGCWSWLVRHVRNYWVVQLVTMSYLVLTPYILRNMGLDFSVSLVGMLLLALNPACWTTRQHLSFAMFLSWLSAGMIMASNVNPVTVSLMLVLCLVALPTMWLEYRSRIDLPPLAWDWQVQQLTPIPWHSLVRVAGLTLGTGLMMALLLFLLPKPNLAQMAANLDYSWLDKLPQVSNPDARRIDWGQSSSPHSLGAGVPTPASSPSPAIASALPANPVMVAPSTSVPSPTSIVLTVSPTPSNSLVAGQSGSATVLGQTPQIPSITPVIESSIPPSSPLPGNESGQPVAAVTSELRSLTEQSTPPTNRSPNASPPGDLPKNPNPIDQVPAWQAIGILLMGGVVIFCGFSWWRYERAVQGYHRRIAQLPPLEQIYRQLLKQLKQQGLPAKRSPQSPTEYATLVGKKLPPPSAQIVDRISQAYVAWRYGHKSANIDLLQQLLQELIALHPQQKSQ
jgi:Domain of unknown function (DUF4129)